MSIKEKLNQIPTSPGIYFFKNKCDEIIYIGKAKILRSRVRSYFNKLDKKDSKTKIMTNHIKDIEWLVVRSEVEALITEANFIKEHKPRYNIFLKDDKTFPYIRITNEPYPRVEIIRQKNLSKDDNDYFGPYTDAKYLREVLRVLHKVFPIRTCTYLINSQSISEGKIKVCLDYHIKRCDGPCEGLINEKAYNSMIIQIKLFLKGRSNEICDYLQSQMNVASEKLKYEEAAKYRDQIDVIRQFIKKQKKTTIDFKDRDVLVVSAENMQAIGLVLRIRNGSILGREKIIIKVHNSDTKEKILSQFIIQYYSSTIDIPEEVLIAHKFDEMLQYANWLTSVRKKKVTILIPKIGEKKKLVEVSVRNADLLLSEIKLKQIKRNEHLSKPIIQLKDDLGMEIDPRRIEAFDNSNIQGASPVAAMVCFVDGKPRKSEFRKFHIKTVKGIDDFASMREIVSRRYKRQLSENKPLPDLILIDGGKGQLSAAKSAIDALGLGYIPIIGLAKRIEEVFKPGLSAPQNISKSSAGLHLLRAIRDEVHRFAINFHRKVRTKKMTDSIFSKIPGVGEKRIQTIWKTFNSIEEIKNSTYIEIEKKTGLSSKLAQAILETAKTIDN